MSPRGQIAGRMGGTDPREGTLCIDATYGTFKVVIVVGPARDTSKVRVCVWSAVGKSWSYARTAKREDLVPLSIRSHDGLVTRIDRGGGLSTPGGGFLDGRQRSTVLRIREWLIGNSDLRGMAAVYVAPHRVAFVPVPGGVP